MKRLNLFYLARQNLKRKLFRTLAIIFSVGVVAGTLFAGTILMKGMESSLEVGAGRLGADIMVMPKVSDQEQSEVALLTAKIRTAFMDKEVEQKIASIPGVKKTSSQVFVHPIEYECCSTFEVLILGFDPKTDFTITPWLMKKLKRPLNKNEAVVGKGYPLAKVGQKIKFYGYEFTIAGVLDKSGIYFLDNSVFIPIEAAYEMAAESEAKAAQTLALKPNQISAVLVQLETSAYPRSVALKIMNSIPDTTAIVINEVVRAVKGQLYASLKSLFIFSGIVWIMSLLMISAIFSMIVNERKREIGLLRAMGANRSFVFRLIMSEATLLTSVGGIVGIASGGLITLYFKNLITSSLNIPYLWPTPLNIFLLGAGCLILSVFTGVIAALYPATASSRLEPYTAIRVGE